MQRNVYIRRCRGKNNGISSGHDPGKPNHNTTMDALADGQLKLWNLLFIIIINNSFDKDDN